jgi:hypothetical protein
MRKFLVTVAVLQCLNLHGMETPISTVTDSVSASASEFVTKSQLCRIMDNFTKDLLGSIKAEIQDNTRTLKEAFARAEEKYSDSIETQLSTLEDRYANISASMAETCNERIARLAEIYEYKLELTQHMLNETEKEKKAAQKEKELIAKIGWICSTNHLNPATSIVSQRSSDISAMDTFEGYCMVSEIYEKRFLPFQELLGIETLNIIKGYITDAKISSKTKPVREPNVDVSDRNKWKEPTILECEYNRMISLHRSFFGRAPKAHSYNWSEHGFIHMASDNFFCRKHAYEKLGPIWDAGARVNAELERQYQVAKSKYDVEVRMASKVPFPAAVFDSLVTSVNGFLKQLI